MGVLRAEFKNRNVSNQIFKRFKFLYFKLLWKTEDQNQ